MISRGKSTWCSSCQTRMKRKRKRSEPREGDRKTKITGWGRWRGAKKKGVVGVHWLGQQRAWSIGVSILTRVQPWRLGSGGRIPDSQEQRLSGGCPQIITPGRDANLEKAGKAAWLILIYTRPEENMLNRGIPGIDWRNLGPEPRKMVLRFSQCEEKESQQLVTALLREFSFQ